MNGCLTLEQLQALLAGDLSDATGRAAAKHIDSCPSCERRARQLGGSIDDLLSSVHEPTVEIKPDGEPRSTPTISTDPFQTRIDQQAAAASAYPFLSPAQAPDEFGRLGHYRVTGLLGKGGMALIFRAEDTVLHRPVALKVMKPTLAENHEGCIRFLREAQVMAAIQHDHVVTVHQVAQEGQTIFLALELLAGQPLDAWIRETRKRAMADVVRIGKEIASGLTIIHEHGVVHRDLKPSNVWLKRKDSDPPGRFQVKILDFGLAGLLTNDADLTASGIALGTPAYMSPEQARGKKVDPRSDLFSLGCILYELCAGKKPFADDHTMAALTSLAIDTPVSVGELNAQAPQALSDLIDDLLEKNPDDRPPSAHAVFEQLAELERAFAGDDETVAIRPAAQRPSRRSARSKRSWWTTGRILAMTFALALAVGLGFFAVTRPGRLAANKGEAAPKDNFVLLSELKPIQTEHWPFVFPEGKKKGKQPGKKEDGSLDVHVGGWEWPNAIFMHPPGKPFDGQPASLSYKLDKRFSRFQSEVSINHDQVAMAPQVFSVYGDGALLWRSAKGVRSDEDRQKCDIAIKGVDVLKIEVKCLGEIKGAHAVWLNPFVQP